MEYLVALLVGRLTLHPIHARKFLDNVVDKAIADRFTVIAKFLITALEKAVMPDRPIAVVSPMQEIECN
jgi:hypothetical protein